MKGFLGLLAAFVMWMAIAGLASAQTHQVGDCLDKQGPLNIYESVRHFAGYQDKITQFVRPAAFPAQPEQVYGAIPDPSGIHLLQIRSAAVGTAFWLARDGALVAINAYGVQVVGHCTFRPDWASQFPAPAFVPMPQMMPVNFDNDVFAATPIVTTANGARIPMGILQPGIYSSVPRLMSLAQAEECYARADGNRDELFLCAAEKSMGKQERAAVECARERDQTATGLCLLGNNLPAGQQQAIQDVADCYQNYGKNWDEYPLCMAEKKADPQTARIINCARQQMQQGQEPDYWTLGYCAFGQSFLNPNPESAIAIQCAMATRGQPGPFVACAGGRLLYRELDKCLNDGIGGDHGCFGKNNTLTKAYDAVENELRKALGEKSLAFKAWQAARLSMDPHQMAEATRQVKAELDRVIAQGNTVLKEAGKNALEWVDAATPDVTVSMGGIKIEGVKLGQVGKGLKCCKF